MQELVGAKPNPVVFVPVTTGSKPHFNPINVIMDKKIHSRQNNRPPWIQKQYTNHKRTNSMMKRMAKS
jgi:hypothetical protein